jgi:DNA-binding NarL/FixJ family response regulator
MIKILVIERSNVGEDLLRRSAELASGVVGKTNTAKSAVDLLATGLEVQILLMDLADGSIDFSSLMDTVRWKYPSVKVVVISTCVAESDVQNSFIKGAQGYLCFDISALEFSFAIKHIEAGNRYLSSACISNIILNPMIYGPKASSAAAALTLRELEVLKLITTGLTNQEIADKLFISKRTAEGHRQQLLYKTLSKNTPTLIAYAVTYRLLG